MLKQHYNYLCNQLLLEIQTLEQELKQFPKEDLIICKNGKYQNYCIRNGKHPIYIPKKEIALAETLALKEFKKTQYFEKCMELKSLNSLLSSYPKGHYSSCDMLKPDSPYYKLLQSKLGQLPPELSAWRNAEYEHSQKHPENLIHKTLAGHYVRSKSEVIIANSLYTNQIPYRYECALHLNDTVVYPDFTTLHPIHLKTGYWEHNGLMDNASYRESVIWKLRLYGENNIIPSINLIMTYETLAHPINSEEIDHIITRYFLQ